MHWAEKRRSRETPKGTRETMKKNHNIKCNANFVDSNTFKTRTNVLLMGRRVTNAGKETTSQRCVRAKVKVSMLRKTVTFSLVQ